MSSNKDRGALRRFGRALATPTSRYSLGTLLVVGIVLGILLWGGFNWSMEATNNEDFCISCHEMEENPYKEYRGSVHEMNGSGVQASCPDCHVPKEWDHKVVRKIKASNELYHKMVGTISTREKYQKNRLAMAKDVWETMLATDSRECRNCHDFQAMDFYEQEQRAAERHREAEEKDMTCIQCHQGIAHDLPAGTDEAFDKLEKDLGMHGEGDGEA